MSTGSTAPAAAAPPDLNALMATAVAADAAFKTAEDQVTALLQPPAAGAASPTAAQVQAARNASYTAFQAAQTAWRTLSAALHGVVDQSPTRGGTYAPFLHHGFGPGGFR